MKALAVPSSEEQDLSVFLSKEFHFFVSSIALGPFRELGFALINLFDFCKACPHLWCDIALLMPYQPASKCI